MDAKCELGPSKLPQATNGHGLKAKIALRSNERILQVAIKHCIVEPKELPKEIAQNTPGGIPDSFTWDVRLAVKLLEASLGKWSPLWSEYGKLLPSPGQLSQPLLFHQSMLAELHHNEAALAAQAQQQRLRSLFPELMPAAGAGPEMFPSQLQWTFALVRSRAFAMGDNHYALVPFLDLANMSTTPNVDFEFSEADNCFYLKTIRTVAIGEELTLSSGTLDNKRMFARLGWVEPGGNIHDQLPGLSGNTSATARPAGLVISRKRIFETLRTQGYQPDKIDNPYLQACLNSLPLSDEASHQPAQEAKICHQLKLELMEIQKKDFKTGPEEDVRRVQMIKSRKERADPRLVNFLLYRMERKTLINTAITLLGSHEQALHRQPKALGAP